MRAPAPVPPPMTYHRPSMETESSPWRGVGGSGSVAQRLPVASKTQCSAKTRAGDRASPLVCRQWRANDQFSGCKPRTRRSCRSGQFLRQRRRGRQAPRRHRRAAAPWSLGGARKSAGLRTKTTLSCSRMHFPWFCTGGDGNITGIRLPPNRRRKSRSDRAFAAIGNLRDFKNFL